MRLAAVSRHLRPAAGEATPRLPIVDVHTHFYDPSRTDGVPWPSAAEPLLFRTVLPDDFLEIAGPCGVTATVVVEASPRYEDNVWVLAQAERNRCIVGLCGSVAPNRPEFAAEIRALARSPLFRGIRIGAPPADLAPGSLWWTDMALMAELDLQVDLIVEPSLESYAPFLELAERTPNLRSELQYKWPISPNLNCRKNGEFPMKNDDFPLENGH